MSALEEAERFKGSKDRRQKAFHSLINPLSFGYRLFPRIWGGDRFRDVFRRDTTGLIGESWEVHGCLEVRSGEFQGRTLDTLVSEFGTRLLGEKGAGWSRFPLLIKWLDCRDWLSVQVHPDDQHARELVGSEMVSGKSEAWYVAHCEPDAMVLHGLRDGVKVLAVEALDESSKILEMMNCVKPKVGDLILTEAGTPHALGPGLLVYEIQQASDLTYRFYDWGRDRPVHPKEFCYSLKESSARATVIENHRVDCPHFNVLLKKGEQDIEVSKESFVIIGAVEGSWRLSGPFGDCPLVFGESLLLASGMGQVLASPEGDGPDSLIQVRLG